MNSKKCHSVFEDEWFTNKKLSYEQPEPKIKRLHGVLSAKKKLIYRQWQVCCS